jgi:hypothetical protein
MEAVVRKPIIVGDAMRAAHASDAKRVTAKMHLFAPAEDPRGRVIDGEFVADGLDGRLLCGGVMPVPKDEVVFMGDVIDDGDGGDELSRILWENFPNRCSECVLRDKARRAFAIGTNHATNRTSRKKQDS